MDLDILQREFNDLKKRVEPMLKEYEAHVAERAAHERVVKGEMQEIARDVEGQPENPTEPGKDPYAPQS